MGLFYKLKGDPVVPDAMLSLGCSALTTLPKTKPLLFRVGVWQAARGLH
jgi:hypothetical protein